MDEQRGSRSLDPADWRSLRALGHTMLDDLFDDLAAVGDGPVWRPMPDNVRAAWQAPVPRNGTDLEHVYAEYRRLWRRMVLATGTPGSSGGCMAAAP